jgi:hypothetical protein
MKFVYRIEDDIDGRYTVRSNQESEAFVAETKSQKNSTLRRIWQREAGINNPWSCVFDKEREDRLRKFKSLT